MKLSENLNDNYILHNGKNLRFGYTTGSCASAAAKAAAAMLFSNEAVKETELLTPAGVRLHLEILNIKRGKDVVSCAVRKDGGDDPDATDGMLVYAKLQKEDAPGIIIKGGEGIGRVTRPGMDQPVGEFAINRVPREMITKELSQLCSKYSYTGGLTITFSIPGGEEKAKHTFNPRLGIEGGLSILGTSGIVVPMSEEALIKTIEVEMRMISSAGKKELVIVPGNYGKHFAIETMHIEPDLSCSNFLGKTIDMAVEMGIERILFIAHIGKFIKVAGGIMNTHSHEADCRMELLSSCAVLCGADRETALAVLNAATTEDGVDILKKTPYFDDVMKLVKKRILFYLDTRAGGTVNFDVILFSNREGRLI